MSSAAYKHIGTVLTVLECMTMYPLKQEVDGWKLYIYNIWKYLFPIIMNIGLIPFGGILLINIFTAHINPIIVANSGKSIKKLQLI